MLRSSCVEGMLRACPALQSHAYAVQRCEICMGMPLCLRLRQKLCSEALSCQTTCRRFGMVLQLSKVVHAWYVSSSS